MNYNKKHKGDRVIFIKKFSFWEYNVYSYEHLGCIKLMYLYKIVTKQISMMMVIHTLPLYTCCVCESGSYMAVVNTAIQTLGGHKSHIMSWWSVVTLTEHPHIPASRCVESLLNTDNKEPTEAFWIPVSTTQHAACQSPLFLHIDYGTLKGSNIQKFKQCCNH